MRFASLGSGSDGNALVVEAASGTTTTRVLLDCGFSAKEVERRLGRLNLGIGDLDAILITHEHSDHVGSALTLARRASLPLYMSWGTARAVGADEADVDLHVLWGDETAQIRDLAVLPYTVPHDAREPLQFVFMDGCRRLGVLTDVGASTPHITAVLSGCDALVLESNHDTAMLAASRYPRSLKARIGGSHGHLSNDAAAGILASLERSRLRHLVAAHLSQQNNLPELARQAFANVLGTDGSDVVVASQEAGFDWLGLGYSGSWHARGPQRAHAGTTGVKKPARGPVFHSADAEAYWLAPEAGAAVAAEAADATAAAASLAAPATDDAAVVASLAAPATAEAADEAAAAASLAADDAAWSALLLQAASATAANREATRRDFFMITSFYG